MQIDLTGKKAVVTGGNIGIGRAISMNLAQYGAEVALTYYSHQEAAEETVNMITSAGGKATAYPLDVTDHNQVKVIVDQAAESFSGRIDILVNNAGHLVARQKIE